MSVERDALRGRSPAAGGPRRRRATPKASSTRRSARRRWPVGEVAAGRARGLAGRTRRRRPARRHPTASASAAANRPTPAYRSRARSPGRAGRPSRTASTKVRRRPGAPARSRGPRRRPRAASARRRAPASSRRPARASPGRPGRATTTASGSPTDGATVSTAPTPGQSPSVTRSRSMPGAAMRQWSIATTSWERCRRRPGPPLGVDRELDAGAPVEPVRRRRAPARRRRRRRGAGQPVPAARATTSALSARCAGSATCWKSQPPQSPGPAYGHGGATRSGEARQHRDGIRTDEPLTGAGLGDPGEHPLAREGVAHEEDLARRAARRSGRRGRPAVTSTSTSSPTASAAAVGLGHQPLAAADVADDRRRRAGPRSPRAEASCQGPMRP